MYHYVCVGMYFVCHRRVVSPFGVAWRDLVPSGTEVRCGWLAMAPPSSWSTNNQAHVSASNHSNPIGTTHVPPPMRIRTHGHEYESYEGPEEGHARLSNSAQSEVRDMRHATAHHFYEDKSIMSHCNDGSHSNHTTTIPNRAWHVHTTALLVACLSYSLIWY